MPVFTFWVHTVIYGAPTGAPHSMRSWRAESAQGALLETLQEESLRDGDLLNLVRVNGLVGGVDGGLRLLHTKQSNLSVGVLALQLHGQRDGTAHALRDGLGTVGLA